MYPEVIQVVVRPPRKSLGTNPESPLRPTAVGSWWTLVLGSVA
jgi:hypothetical protein